MKRFLKRFTQIASILFLLLLLTLFISQKIPLPTGETVEYSDPYITSKVNYLDTTGEIYNTIFFGSSHIYRHLNTHVFDSLNHPLTKTFNMGIPSMRLREYEKIIEIIINKLPNLQNILIEASTFKEYKPKGQNIYSSRYLYCFDLVQGFSDLNYMSKKRWPKYLILLIKSELIRLKWLIKIKWGASDKPNGKNRLVGKDGYYPLDLENRDCPGKFEHRRRRLSEKSTAEIIKNYTEEQLYSKNCPRLTKLALSRITDKLKSKGYNVYVVFTPRSRVFNISFLNSISGVVGKNFDQINLIQNKRSNLFDEWHLNSTGAYNWSANLGKEFEILREKH